MNAPWVMTTASQSPGGAAGGEKAPTVPGQVLFGGDEELPDGERLLRLADDLFEKVVRDGDERLLGETELPQGHHRKDRRQMSRRLRRNGR